MANENTELIRRFDLLADLLALSKEQWDRNSNLYKIQDSLRANFRNNGVAFLYSMPLRFLWRCRKCGQKFTQVSYQMENPALAEVAKTSFGHIHGVREHDFPIDEHLKIFLNHVNYSTLED